MFRYHYMIVAITDKAVNDTEVGDIIVETLLDTPWKIARPKHVELVRDNVQKVNKFKHITILNMVYMGREFVLFKNIKNYIKRVSSLYRDKMAKGGK